MILVVSSDNRSIAAQVSVNVGPLDNENILIGVKKIIWDGLTLELPNHKEDKY